MTTTFKHALQQCGFSQSEAAAFLNVPVTKIKHWSAGRSQVPDGVWDELRVLYAHMTLTADEALDLIEEKQPDGLDLSYSGEHGLWPCAGNAFAVEAMIWLQTDKSPTD